MSNFGFGFSPFEPNEPGHGPDDLSGKIPLFAELQRLLSGNGGPVNWDLARQLAISTLAAHHRATDSHDAATVAEAIRLADLWLDAVTDLPSGVTTSQAWSRVDWVEKTIATWSALCDPVASRVVSAMSGALPPEVAEQAGPMAPMMSQLGGMMFGAQLGQGLAALAGEVVSSSEIGLPLGPAGTAGIVVDNLTALAAEVDRPLEEVRLFESLREAAHQRLFAHVPWLRQQLIDSVDAYGRGISIDPQAISSMMSELDPQNPESLQRALSGGMFEPQNTEAQQAALRRLETLLALTEGWVDAVVLAAAGDRLQGAPALAEAMRRRRASGGPAEQTFATLVGLELRPRRLRDAAALWGAMGQLHGTAARDALWNHPDLLPTSEDLDDPLGFASNYGTLAEFEVPDDLSSLASAGEADGDASATATDGSSGGGAESASDASTEADHQEPSAAGPEGESSPESEDPSGSQSDNPGN
ncbi:MAG TPA: zinc-dependent metalloprotease [Jatrophihabitans sp.]|nr:zinc-dependent metalloprotease [Jatrophihabitans sp.]